ncbi:MAG: hypothetical protein AAGA48_07975 [Myxococcota bacterium]
MQRWLCALCVLVAWCVPTSAAAEPGIQLPKTEDADAWTAALKLAGLAPRLGEAPLRLETTGGVWRIVAVAEDGQERRVVVDAPRTATDREAVAFLARGLLREVLRNAPRPPAHPLPPPKGIPAKTQGAAEAPETPPTKGMTTRPGRLEGTAARVILPSGVQNEGTDDPAPIVVPEGDGEVYVTDLPRWRREGQKVLSAPPLWLRVGGSVRSGLVGSAQIMAGTELVRRGRLRLNIEIGGVPARNLEFDVPRLMGQFDVEGSATVALVGAASVGAGIGTSYRMYRQQGFLVDQHLVPTAQLRLDVPLVSGRKLAVVAHVQGKMDLARTDLVLPDGRTSELNRFEIQPALILRYHGALELLSNYRKLHANRRP